VAQATAPAPPQSFATLVPVTAGAARWAKAGPFFYNSAR